MEREIAAEFRDWLGSSWDPERPLQEWRGLLVGAGWSVPSWPERSHGRGLPGWAEGVVASEISAAGVVGNPVGVGFALAAPTLLEHGSDQLQSELLRPTLTGEVRWCQLFSEPDAGSDLAGLRATAIRDGDEWVISGQKVWNTSAHHAEFGLLVARTAWDVPKHRGISYFVLPMTQPGIEVRPIEQMNGYSSFNAVHLDEVRIPAANIVGEPGEGWRVARTTLAHERRFATLRRPRYADNQEGRTLAEARAEAEEHFKTYVWYPQRAGRADLVVEAARRKGVADDPIVRQEIAGLLSFARANEWTAARARAARSLGREPGPEGSLGKLAASEVARRAARTHATIAGSSALLAEGPDPIDAIVAEVLVSSPAQSIAGGTDEIQRNIIGERILGLPREPSVDQDVPFGEVATSSG